MPEEAQYAHGHHPSVLRSHKWRTVENSAAYLVPHLTPTTTILDVGCGPGNITIDLASRVPSGHVIGLDRADIVIADATSLAKESGVANVEFHTGDVYALDFPDGTFDVVHAHQVLQHLGDPVRALKEMRRVTKKGGIVAVRDMTDFLHWPEKPELVEFRELFWGISTRLGTHPGAGKMFRKFAREAGFEQSDVTVTSSNWTYADQEGLDFWAGMWADRVLQSEFHDNCVSMGMAKEEDMQRISRAWKDFQTTQDAWYVVTNGELIAKNQ
ncbi:methyltransferase-UbiE family protein [Microthyrium microscopicum]|uniref:Methyltransferase-UbiE family protein n=1 Tax=Microthyrium microscopicum TaxID=703497 RepID=A0A6A6US02_9PEZI|nr:methyltransferase-UbiE family protein [Microthyrium microscopicum]